MSLLKRLLALSFLLSVSSSIINAAPAWPFPVEYKQPDGSTVKVKITGDEFSHRYLRATDLAPLAMTPEGTLLEAASNKLLPQTFGLSVEQNIANPAGVGLHSTTYTRQGTVPTLVILVQFADVKFSMSDPSYYYNRFLNQSGFSDNGNQGSVADYFKAQSHDKFTPRFDVFGPVTLSSNRSAYANTSDAYKMVHQSCNALDSQINFATYDVNNDGEVDNVYIIYAGQGANSGASNAPWPHNYNCPTSLLSKQSNDGKLLKHYACAPELQSATTPDGIGTFIHEFGHTIGLSDHYNTNQSVNNTPTWWDVMDIGCYLNSSRTPCNYSAYERVACDWMSLTSLDDPAKVILRSMHDTDFAVKIETGRTNDYYILENRPRLGWDSQLYAGGMLIWHIDASSSSLSNNPNNDNSHHCVQLVRADNLPDDGGLNTLYGDPYPGSTSNTSFTSTSTPAMVRWNASSGSATTPVTGHEVTDITKLVDATITFNYRGGSAANIVDPTPAPRYTFSVDVDDSDAGIAYIGNDQTCTSASFEDGETIQLHAAPNTWYQFVNWTNPAGAVISTNPNTPVKSSEANAGTYTAHFRLQDGAPAKACTPTGNQAGTYGRYISSLAISDNLGTSVEISGIQTSSSQPIYHDKTSQTLVTQPGAVVTVNPGGSAIWTHTYLYVDWDNDGFNYTQPSDYVDPANNYAILPGSDLVYYSRWSPQGKDPDQGGTWYSSTDGRISGNDPHNWTATTAFQFTVPQNLAPGVHRIRFKSHWGSLDPCGGQDSDKSSNNTIQNVDGCVVDFLIQIDPGTPYTVTVQSADPTLGTVSIEQSGSQTASVYSTWSDRALTLTATPATEQAVFRGWSKEGVTVSEENPYNLEVTAETAGTYTALFAPSSSFVGNDYPQPNGSTHENFFLASASTSGEGSNHLDYSATEHPGKFHTVVSATEAPVIAAGKTFTLNLQANDAGSGTNNIGACIARIYSDFNGSGSFQNLATYGSTWRDNSSVVKNITHSVTIPENTPTGMHWLRVIYHHSYGTGAAQVNATSTNIDRGISYDFPVMVANSNDAIDSIEANPESSPAQYFNLQGVEVSSANLTPGIYICRQNGKTKKVIIR